ncbi:MAG: MFS transporter [Lachnospiraceae bacterium]|nr:MFS transporter [Lachnospiraceae bacterium]
MKLGRKFWASMLIFGLIGQVAWVVENMYFNVFIYKMFHATAAEISLMVGASSVAATVTTLLMGALSDKLGKRKVLISLGYVVWGISILSFALIRVDLLTPLAGSTAAAMSLGVNLVIILDCVMTFFGSTANDAAYNAWLTDRGDETNRGRIEGYNSMMPLVSILVVFGGFMGFDLDRAESWTTIFLIIGGVVLLIGILGLWLIEEAPDSNRSVAGNDSYWATVTYSFRPSVVRANPMLYAVLGAFAVFGISIQVFMPYLILYYEQSLGMTDYVLVFAPAILLAAVATALYGKVYDKKGFMASIVPSIAILMAGYVILYFTRSKLPVFVGSLCMMIGYLTGMAVFGAMIRDHIPENRAGQFQGVRIIGQVLIPGIVGPAIGAWILRDAQVIVNNDGTTSFLPDRGIWVGALVVAVVLCGVIWGIGRKKK